MTVRMRRLAALSLLCSFALFPASALAASDVPPPAPVPATVVPAPVSPTPVASPTGTPPDDAASPDAPPVVAPAPVAGSERALLNRAVEPPMGHNNGVRLWVHGDGSGAALRVRLQVTNASATDDAQTPTWISTPVALTFSGWREVLIPKSKFMRRADASNTGIDLTLPADAQTETLSAAPTAWAKINSVGLEFDVPRRSALVVDDLYFVTLNPAGAVASGVPVDDFEKGNVAAWVPGGTAAQQKLLTYGLATQAALVHGGRVAFRMDAVSPAYIRDTTQLPAIKTSLATSGKPYLVYVPAGRFDPILPSSLPLPQETTSQLSIQACADQVQAATFCVYSQKPLQNVTVTLPNDLQAVGHILSRNAVDVRVVKVWQQLGVGPLRSQDLAGPTPELLVKDDRVPLTGAAPVARLTGAPVTDIAADSTKQFWITVAVPRNALPDHYTGNLLVSGRGIAAPIPVRLDINVLPMRLQSAAKQYAIDLRSRLDPAPAALPSADGRQLVTDFVSKPVLDAQLADIITHGFRITTAYDSPDTLWDAVAERQKYGFMEPYIYKGDGDAATLEAARAAHRAPAFLYYTDRDPIAQTETRLAAMSKGGLLATTYITRPSDYDALQADLEVPVYNRDSPYTQTLLRTNGRRQSSKRDWWYWTATDEDPETNRLDCGVLLWRANLYGAFVPAYQLAFGTDPYDETSAGAVPAQAQLRPEMLTYPVQGGVLDTLQWEACREGVSDVRYLTTLFLAIGDCRHVYKIAKPQTDAAEAYAKAFLAKPAAAYSDADLDKARYQIATYSMQLNALITAYKKANHLQ